ncbi:MAG: VirB4 family type IV secretion/conjugal transfer ATPase, partial [Rickettsiales bacterium]|nr:VirB4 family type IV secretion/conjugal transfer ATPase [Rickettsiales bacterium]
FGFGVTHMVEDGITLIPVLSYLFHRIRAMLDGSPTIMVLDEAWQMIDNPIFAPHISTILDEFRAKNAIVILATESVDDARKSSITRMLTEKLQTAIFLPNPKANEAYGEVFGLSEEEIAFIQTMRTNKRQFLIKHYIDSVVAELDLSGMDALLAVLSATPQNLAVAEGLIKEKGSKPEDWLSTFMEKAVT